MANKKNTHKDNLEDIGRTFKTSTQVRERRWNAYYHRASAIVVKNMLKNLPVVQRGTVIDLGTSHGAWFPFWQHSGFTDILGVELHTGRAQLAKQAGYHEVYNTDAANVPHPDTSIDLAFSANVFVHILQLEDKRKVLLEAKRLLKPGGALILEHPIASAFGFTGYHIQGVSSFLELNDFIVLVQEAGFKIVDIKPAYFTLDRHHDKFWRRVLNGLIILPIPFMPYFRTWLDPIFNRILSLDEANTIYIKAVKPEKK